MSINNYLFFIEDKVRSSANRNEVMKKEFILLFLSVLLTHKVSAGLDFAPTTTLISTTEMSALVMTCSGEKPFKTLECDFIQKSLSRKVDAVAEAEKSLAAWKDKDFEDGKKKIDSLCASGNFKDWRDGKVALEEYDQLEYQLFLKSCICKASAKECVKNYIIEKSGLEAKVCKFNENSFNTNFKQISKNKWMNTPEPKGLCNIVNAITLEFDGKYTWTFNQTRVSADKGELCSAFELNKPATYRTTPGKKFKLACEFAEL